MRSRHDSVRDGFDPAGTAVQERPQRLNAARWVPMRLCATLEAISCEHRASGPRCPQAVIAPERFM